MLRQLRTRFAVVTAAAPRAYWYVWWGTLINRLGGFVVPLLTIYLTADRGVTVSEAGGIVALFGAGQILASVVGGQMSDRLGRRITMISSLLGGAAAMIALGLARDLTAIAVLVGVTGFVGELYRPAVLAFVADVTPPEHRVDAYGLLYWAINLGFAFAAATGGFLADVDFTILFFADAATMAIFALLVWRHVPETRPAAPPKDDAAPPGRSWIRDGDFVVFVVLTLVMSLLPLQTAAPLSAHMTWQGFSAASYGLVLAFNGLLIIAIQPFATTWIARRDPSRVIAFASLLYGAGMALHGLAPNLALHAGAVLVWTMGEILESPTRSTLVAAMAPADARGRYQGALVLAWGCSTMIAPKLGTWLWEHAGPDVLWLGCLGVGALVAALMLITGPARRRRLGSSSPR
jgi:MFS family permease